MTYAQMAKKTAPAEMERRMGVVTRMNVLWDKRNACEDKAKQKRIDKQIDSIRRAETSWLREVAWFLY